MVSVAGFQVKLGFDSTKLEFVGVDWKSLFGTQGYPIESTGVDFVDVQWIGLDPVAAPADVVAIEFSLKDPGGTTLADYSIQYEALMDGDDNPLPHNSVTLKVVNQ